MRMTWILRWHHVIRADGRRTSVMCAESGGEQEQLLVPSMPSMGALAGNLPPDVHVVGFGKTVNVFSSKQRPKELTIYGSDFKCVLA